VTCVMVVSFMGSSFLSWWSLVFSFDRTEARISTVERGSVLQVHSASFPNTDRVGDVLLNRHRQHRRALFLIGPLASPHGQRPEP
jgi:hypothetical protein